MPALRELQERFFRALTQPARAALDPAFLGAVSSTADLDAGERVAIYRSMYRSRLLEVLQEDFSRTRRLLGAPRFAALGRRYVARCPSRHPSLRHFGARFPDLLERSLTRLVPPYAADLSRLEWARLAVFDAPNPSPLRLSSLSAVAAEEWGGLRFRVIDALVTLASRWPIHDIWAALGELSGDDRPKGVSCVAPVAAERMTTLRVWREEHTVYQASMDAVERDALALVDAGESFGALCEWLAGRIPADESPARAAALLARWVEDGILEPALPA